MCGDPSIPIIAAGRGDRLQEIVLLQLALGEQGAGAGMRQEHGPLARLAGLHRGDVTRVGEIDRHPEPVHPTDRVETEPREATVAGILHAATELVRLAVRDPAHPDAEPEEHVEAIELVLDHRGALHAGHHRDAAGPVRLLDVLHGPADEHRGLVRDVGQVHPEVVDHVGPLPAALRRDRGGPVQEVLEDAVQAGGGQPLVAVPLAALADVLVVLVHVDGRDAAVVVERDAHALAEQALGSFVLLVGERIHERLHPAELRGELELLVVDTRLQVRERHVAVPSLLRLHPAFPS